jgi:hypothetical protein
MKSNTILAVEVYDHFINHVESFEEPALQGYGPPVGSCLAYLLGAILKGSFFEVSERELPFTRLLWQIYPDWQHPIWSYITFINTISRHSIERNDKL